MVPAELRYSYAQETYMNGLLANCSAVDFIELYNSSITQMNAYRGGPFQQALSGLTTLNNNWYDGNQYQIYSFEYTPGDTGDIVWYVGQDKTWKLDARAIGPNGNIGQRVMPEEPMSIVANFGMSSTFAAIDLAHLKQLFPSHMRFDYIRIYQKPGSESLTCDPPGYETTPYISSHADVYANPNITSWYVSLATILLRYPDLLSSKGSKLLTTGLRTPLWMDARLK